MSEFDQQSGSAAGGNEDAFQIDPPARTRSTGMKTCLTCGIIFGVGALVICGGGVYFVSGMMNSITEDPAKIQEIADSVVELDAPEGFEAKAGMDWSIPFMGPFKFALYLSDVDMLFVCKAPAAYDQAAIDQSLDQMQMQMKQQMQARGGQNQRQLDIETTETIELTVAGKTAPFKVATGVDQDDAQVVQVTGGFPTNDGKMGLMMLQVAAEKMNKDEAIEFIRQLDEGGGEDVGGEDGDGQSEAAEQEAQGQESEGDGQG